jgi:hypothetical protein
MNHWLLDGIEERRRAALKVSDKPQINHELLSSDVKLDLKLIKSVTNALELATGLIHPFET